jgi:multidrug efflux pump subunit AcrA (membrane-fusion protein)
VFRAASRQARVELEAANPEHRLKPGMFTRATLELDRVEQAAYVPEQALTKRNDRLGLFVLNEAGDRVRWVEVEPGLQDGPYVEVRGDGVSGRVVTLGQQLLDDGSAVRVARLSEPAAEGPPAP